jgi:hypothetical protein
MSLTYVTITSTFSTGGTTPVSVSWMTVPFSVTAGVFGSSIVAGFNAGIQYTLDDGMAGSSMWQWLDTTVTSTSLVSSTLGTPVLGLVANLTSPVTYLRLNIGAAPTAGTGTFKVIQGIG